MLPPIDSNHLSAVRDLSMDLAHALDPSESSVLLDGFEKHKELESADSHFLPPQDGAPRAEQRAQKYAFLSDWQKMSLDELNAVVSRVAAPLSVHDGIMIVADAIFRIIESRLSGTHEVHVQRGCQEIFLPFLKENLKGPFRLRLIAALVHFLNVATNKEKRERPTKTIESGLYVILNPTPECQVSDLACQAKWAALGGASVVQLRAKKMADDRIIKMARACAESLGPFRVPLILNDRPDLVCAAGAHGVHVGLSDNSVDACRQSLGEESFIGASSHTRSDRTGILSGSWPSYLAVGPVFASPTKSGHAAIVGLTRLQDAVRESQLPICAIGGIIDPCRMADIAKVGANWGAIVSAFSSAQNPAWMCARFAAAFHAAKDATDDPQTTHSSES
jgi:thiamine-phosphate pyrophosphorylase